MDNQASEDDLYSKLLNLRLTVWRQTNLNGQANLDHDSVEEVIALIRTEKLKLLAEVRERVIGEDTQNPYSKSSDRFFNDWGYQASEYDKFIRGGMREKLTKLEAEL